MLKNYLTIALRNLGRHKGYAFINISGLALGMTCCLLIVLLVRHEWSFDAFHAHAPSVHRAYIESRGPDGAADIQYLIPPPVGEAMAGEFASIAAYTNVVGGPADLRYEDRIFESRIYMVDPGFFDVFTFPLIAGDPAAVVSEPDGMVLTEETAQKFFGSMRPEEIVGRTMSLPRGDTAFVFTVTGVAEDVPSNSSLRFDALISFEMYEPMPMGANDNGGRTSLYLRLRDGSDAAAFQASLAPFTASEFGEQIQSLRDGGYITDGPDAFRLLLQPLRNLHLNPDLGVAYEESTHNPIYSYVLTGIALLVLLIACINFMILSIGYSTSRAKEVGLRKTLGARRVQVMRQFWGEALLMGGVALLLGLILAALTRPFFNQLTGRDLSMAAVMDVPSLLVLLGLIIVVGLVAGGYPAAVLSGFRPADVLKGNVEARGNSSFTRSLVVIQYTLSVGLIVSTIVMARQLDYILNRDLGFEADQVVVVDTRRVATREYPDVIERFRQALLPDERILNIARAGYSFTRGGDWNGWLDAEGRQRTAANFGIDYEYLDVMGLELVAGRNFSREYPSDPRNSILVNEALVREFGIEDPIGYELTGWNDWYVTEPPAIIGVVRDFNFRSLHEEVRPAVLNMQPDYYVGMGSMLIKVGAGNVAGAVRRIEQTWHDVLPGRPFSFSFLDEDMAALYHAEQRWSRILTYSASIAILIACMGLFGLTTLSTVRRTKEVGIRKVLGASVSGIVALLSREFVVLVLVASVAAAPLAYFAMDRWLANFAYHIDLSWWMFALAGIAALGIALLTVSYQAVKAALADPVKSLRYE